MFWVEYYITQNLREYSLEVHTTQNPWNLRGQILHFGDRYAYLNGPFNRLHPSNTVFLTWFHGEPDDPNKEMQKIFRQLREADPYVNRYVVSCIRSREVLIEQGIRPDKISLIPLGIDLTCFTLPTADDRRKSRHDLGIPDGVTCIGSFQKDGSGWEDGLEPKLVKGPDVFLKAIETIYQNNKKILIILTGPGRGYIKKGLEAIGVPYLHHYLSNYHDIVKFYHALDMYLITSRAEGGPQALLECWATGVPVVSTRMGMPADLIHNGENGFLSDIEDWKNIAEKACFLIDDTNLRKRIINSAVKQTSNYDWSVIAKMYYHELYKQ